MTRHEILQSILVYCLPVLYGKGRSQLRRLLRLCTKSRGQLLDVGGRASPYTIGLKADVTVIDMLRTSEVQSTLHLGLDDRIINDLRKKRSNITSVIIGDILTADLPLHHFQIVSSVEVIEHIVDDEKFIARLSELVTPAGFLFLTTPNGDYIKNTPPHHNPDHVRHYTRTELTEKLSKRFQDVSVWYGVKTGRHRVRGLRGISPSRPLVSLMSAASNVYNLWESRGMEEIPRRTAHLFAVASRPVPAHGVNARIEDRTGDGIRVPQ